MKPSTIVSLIGFVLGVASILILARDGFNLTFTPFFLKLLDVLEALTGALTYPIQIGVVEPILKWLKDLGLPLELQPHWKHYFVIVWLQLGSFAKVMVPSGGRRTVLFELAWGGLAATAFGASAGVVSPSSVSIPLWYVACIALFQVGRIWWWENMLGDEGRAYIRGRGGVGANQTFLLFAIFAIAGAFTTQISPLSGLGLGTIVGYVLADTLRRLEDAASDQRGEGDTKWQKFFNDPSAQVALQVLSVLGLAAIIVAFNQLTV